MSTKKSATSRKLNILAAACADKGVSATGFRFLFRVAAGLNQHTGKAVLGDDLLRDEVAGLKGDGAQRKHRRALERLGYLNVEAGSGLEASVYELVDGPVRAILVELKAKKELRQSRRVERRAAARTVRQQPPMARDTPVQIDGGENSREPSRTPVQSDGGVSAPIDQRPLFGEGGLNEPAPPVWIDPHTRSSFPSRSKKEGLNDKEVPKSTQARKRVLTYRPLASELDAALLDIGDGDPERGHRRLDLMDDAQLQAFAERLDEFGYELSLAEVRAMRAAALQRESIEPARRSDHE